MGFFSLFDICSILEVDHSNARTTCMRIYCDKKDFETLKRATKHIKSLDVDNDFEFVLLVPTYLLTADQMFEVLNKFKKVRSESSKELLLKILYAEDQDVMLAELNNEPDPEHIPVPELSYIDKLKEEHCKSHKEMTHEAYEYYEAKKTNSDEIVKPTDKHAFARSQTNNCYRALWYEYFTKDGFTLDDDCIVDIKQWFYKYNNEDKNTNIEISKYLYDHGREKELENLIELQKENIKILKQLNHNSRIMPLLNIKMQELKG